MKEKILKYLCENNDGQFQDITHFLITEYGNSNLRILAELIDKMEKGSLIVCAGEWNKIGIQSFDLNTTKIQAKIKQQGISEYENYTRSLKQDEWLRTQSESTVLTNKSLRDTNASVIGLNTETKKYYTKQKNTGYAIVFFTAVSVIISSITFFKESQSKTAKYKKELQEMKGKQLELERALKAHIVIDSLRDLKAKKYAKTP